MSARGSSIATLQGLAAVGLWSTLAVLTTLTREVPPFELAALSFTIATAVGIFWTLWSRESFTALRSVPISCWLLGVYGLLGFHVLYFAALQNAPPLEANLINYLWPLLIVLLAGWLAPGSAGGVGGLRWWHIAGALLGFCGAGLLLAGGAPASFGGGSAYGYLAAVASAIVWATYSVLSRRFASVPTTVVTGYCALTALGAAAGHLLVEQTVWPQSTFTWLAILAQGIGPVGLAFYLWDRGMKFGNLRFLGAASYSAPLLSSLLLITFGLAHASSTTWVSAGLITAGAALCGVEMFAGRRSNRQPAD